MDDLEAVAREISACELCDLHIKRTLAVPGGGNRNAKIMVVGEAPGKFEDLKGKPFVGMSGRFLDKYLEQAVIKREDVFITNAVKCRPPNNRKPTSHEITTCRPYLIRQLNLVKPALILALGTSAASSMNLEYKHLSEIRGKVISTVLDGTNVSVFATFHPSFPMRFPSKRTTFLNDLKRAGELAKNTTM